MTPLTEHHLQTIRELEGEMEGQSEPQEPPCCFARLYPESKRYLCEYKKRCDYQLRENILIKYCSKKKR
jgi:hypothetical protein